MVFIYPHPSANLKSQRTQITKLVWVGEITARERSDTGKEVEI